MHEDDCSKTIASIVPSTRYQDYVIRDGQYIGQFEDMYQNAAEIPWHQDETVNAIFSDLTVAILKRRSISSLLDVGCGMGYMVARLKNEIPGLTRVVELDISPTATAKAAALFPDIEFRAGTLDSDTGGGRPLMWSSARMSSGMCWTISKAMLPKVLTEAGGGCTLISHFRKGSHF